MDEDGHFIDAADGTERWVDADGHLHRLSGPAMKSPLADEWFYHGRRHRIDGPAIINKVQIEHNPDSHAITYRVHESRLWFVNDRRLNSAEVENWLKENRIDLNSSEGQALFVARFS